ncbi:uncharacterized protein LOC143581548 [Bidens hawaiensis]|uniref:uncharacterized protein LOC143581548 n=1 Tax=Bidens hawaiensis TaxID=980011 RepID=UPI00404B70A7
MDYMMKMVIKDGKKSLFWLDLWIGEEMLCNTFPLLFRLEQYKDCCVAERLVMVNGEFCGVWDWRRRPGSIQELNELFLLLQVCQNVQLGDGIDTTCWSINDSSDFSVAGLKQKIQELTHSTPNYRFVWNNWVPRKVEMLAWRIELEKIPVMTLLANRNIDVGSVSCPMCGDMDESVEHLFVSSGVARLVWQAVSSWCKITSIFALDIHDLLDLYKLTNFPKRKAKIFHAICLGSIWCIWKAINDLVFNGKPIMVESIVGEIKTLGYLWIKHRSGETSLLWEDWCMFKV